MCEEVIDVNICDTLVVKMKSQLQESHAFTM